MTIEQTEPDPYSIALRRLEKVLRETNAVAIVGWIDDCGMDRRFVCGLNRRFVIPGSDCDLPDAINAACDAVEGVRK
jgi:hypothetical protein